MSRSPSGRAGWQVLMMVGGVVMGILVFGGLLAVHAVYMVPYPCTGCSTPTPDQVAAHDTIRGLAWIAIIALDLAAGFSVALAFVIGSRNDVPEVTRRAVFLFSTIYVAAWLFGSYFLFTLLNLARFYY
jgi:hypothetical protein